MVPASTPTPITPFPLKKDGLEVEVAAAPSLLLSPLKSLLLGMPPSPLTSHLPPSNLFCRYSALGCRGKKALPDLSMLADPNSGLMIYWSEPTATNNCVAPNCYSIAGMHLPLLSPSLFLDEYSQSNVGGTSLAAPLAAARAAIRGVQITPDSVYTSTIAFRDITAGDNGGHACGNGYELSPLPSSPLHPLLPPLFSSYM